MHDDIGVTVHGIDWDAIWPIPAVYLLHGKGGSPNGTVRKLADVLARHWPGLEFHRPCLPHFDPHVPAEESVEHLLRMELPRGAMIVGVSLGGLVAAKLQEAGRGDLKVIALSSPTWSDQVRLERRGEWRLALYSSRDEVIASRVAGWPQLASIACDCDWLTHNTDEHLRPVTRFFDWTLEGNLPRRMNDLQTPSWTRQERDDVVWNSMAKPRERMQAWRESPWDGGRPQTFAEMGDAMQSGQEWEIAWGDWLHEFVYRKDPRCLAGEPPTWFPPESRAMLAGTAEFFANLYGLPKPDWSEKPEYFLPELDYYGCVISFSATEHALLLPESEADDYRLRAKAPKEMLRRNVVFSARSLTVL